MTGHGRERRRAVRVRADSPIQIETEIGTFDGVLRDLSPIGLCCRLPAALREMTLVKMGIELPGAKRPLTVQGVVVRAEKLRDLAPATYDIAVYFSDIDHDARLAIEAFGRAQAAATA